MKIDSLDALTSVTVGGNDVYHEGNKPTASEVGALPTTGGTLTGDVAFADTKGITFGPASTASKISASGYDLTMHSVSDITIHANSDLGTASGDEALNLKASNNNLKVGTTSGLTYNGNKVYHAGDKPTASDVGALPLTGGTLTGKVLSTAYTPFVARSGGYEATFGVSSREGEYLFGGAATGREYDTYLRMGDGRLEYYHLGTNRKIYHEGFKPTASDVGAAPSGWGLGVGAMQKDPNTLHAGGFWRDLATGLSGITMPFDGTPSSRAMGVTNAGGLRAAVRTGSNSYVWKKIYSEVDKPTASDVGALPMSGGTLTGSLHLGNNNFSLGGTVSINRLGGSILCSSLTGASKQVVGTAADALYFGNNTLTTTNIETKAGGVIQHLAGGVASRIYTTSFKPTAADTGALPLSGGTLSGRLSIPNNIGGVTDVTDATNAPIFIGSTNIGTTNKFLPFGHMSAMHSSGYRTHLNFGLLKTTSQWGEGSTGMYVALGGNDSNPTEHFLMAFGGKLKHSRGHEFYSTAFKPTAGDVGLSNISKGNNSELNISTSYGSVSVGPVNAGHCHYITDRPNHYFNKELRVNGEVYCGANYGQRVYHQGYKPTASDVGALATSGGTLTGNLTFSQDNILSWARNTDYANIGFKNASDADTDSYMWFKTGDNGNEFFKFQTVGNGVTNDLAKVVSTGMMLPNSKTYSIEAIEANAISLTNQKGPLPPGTVGQFVGGISSNWYNDNLKIGHARSGSTGSEGFTVQLNNANLFRVLPSNRGVYYGNNQVYHQGYKPSAGDVGALPVSGGTMSGNINYTSYGSCSFGGGNGDGAGFSINNIRINSWFGVGIWCTQGTQRYSHYFNARTGDFGCLGNVTAFSDRRVKDNIKNIPNALDKVMKLNGVTYTRTDQEDKEKVHTGLIAQEVEAVLPEAVHTSENGDIKDFKSVAYGNLVGLLVEAIKELKQEVEDLKNGNANRNN